MVIKTLYYFKLKLVIACIMISFLNFHAFTQVKPYIKLNLDQQNEDFGTIEVRGWDLYILNELAESNLSDDEWKSIFQVYTNNNPDRDLPQVYGTYKITKEKITFEPRFPFIEGMRYYVRFNFPLMASIVGLSITDPANQEVIEKNIQIPDSEKLPATIVEKIYPTANKLPGNQLRIYIYFSNPMSQGNAYNNIYLFDEEGNKVEKPFLEINQELWDPDHTRFTLWFDPGRIKRDLQPNLQKGVPLKKGKKYVLKINKNWEDVYGNPLKESYEKHIEVMDPDRVIPDPERWNFEFPEKGSKEALIIHFNEPMDHALLRRLIQIKNSKGMILDGEIEIYNNEKSWEFHPIDHWISGNYYIQIDSDLEDLAGNNLNRLFDSELDKDSIDFSEKVEIKFTVR